MPPKRAQSHMQTNMNKAINIIQWNCKGICPKTCEFASFLNSLKTLPYVILKSFLKAGTQSNSKDIKLSDLMGRMMFPWVTYHFKSFRTYATLNLSNNNTDMREGGSVIQFHYCIPGPSVFLNHGHRTIKEAQDCRLLCAPGKSFSGEELETILDHQDAIIFGDMNAHSPKFRARHSNRRGKIVEDLTHNLNLVILNTGESTYLVTNDGISPIDIIIIIV